MKKILRMAAVIIIPLFCMWHMVGIATYLIPQSAHLPLMQSVIRPIKAVTAPYVLITSQWQMWNIFSPNPLRRVSTISLDKRIADDQWQTVRWLSPDLLAWPTRVKELKVLGRIEEDWRNDIVSYLLVQCRLEEISNDDVRLHALRYVIPLPDEVRAMGGWNNWHPTVEQVDFGIAHCPALAHS